MKIRFGDNSVEQSNGIIFTLIVGNIYRKPDMSIFFKLVLGRIKSLVFDVAFDG